MTSKNIVQVTDQNFEATIGAAEQPVLLDFWATWCAPCKMLRPVVEELAVEYAGRVTVAELDVDANPQTASKYSVLSIPSLILFRGGSAWAQVGSTVFKTSGRHPWRCRRTDRSRRAPASSCIQLAPAAHPTR